MKISDNFPDFVYSYIYHTVAFDCGAKHFDSVLLKMYESSL